MHKSHIPQDLWDRVWKAKTLAGTLGGNLRRPRSSSGSGAAATLIVTGEVLAVLLLIQLRPGFVPLMIGLSFVLGFAAWYAIGLESDDDSNPRSK